MRRPSAGRNSKGHKGHEQVAERLTHATGLSDAAMIALLWNMVLFTPRAYSSRMWRAFDEPTRAYYLRLAQKAEAA